MKDVAKMMSGTFMEDVLNIMEKGDFVPISHEKIRGEKIIGEMKPFEKGLGSFIAAAADREKELIKSLNSLKVWDFSHPKFKELEALREDAQMAEELFWHSVKRRHDDVSIGIRRGFVIVRIPEKESAGCDGNCANCKEAKDMSGPSFLGLLAATMHSRG